MRRYPEDFLSYIIGEVGSEKYRNFYVGEVDVLVDGKRSCAKFVSEVLKHFDLVSTPHATIKSTIQDMEDFGWMEIPFSSIEPGDVVVYDENVNNRNHLGLYIGNGRVVSNSTKERVIKFHDYEFDGTRKIIKVLALF